MPASIAPILYLSVVEVVEREVEAVAAALFERSS